MNAMRPSIRYIAADRPKGIANVQFVVSAALECFENDFWKENTKKGGGMGIIICDKLHPEEFDTVERRKADWVWIVSKFFELFVLLSRLSTPSFECALSAERSKSNC